MINKIKCSIDAGIGLTINKIEHINIGSVDCKIEVTVCPISSEKYIPKMFIGFMRSTAMFPILI